MMPLRGNQESGSWMGPSQAADTIHGVRTLFESGRELTPQMEGQKSAWGKIKQAGD